MPKKNVGKILIGDHIEQKLYVVTVNSKIHSIWSKPKIAIETVNEYKNEVEDKSTVKMYQVSLNTKPQHRNVWNQNQTPFHMWREVVNIIDENGELQAFAIDEPAFDIGPFPIRQDITVLGPDEPARQADDPARPRLGPFTSPNEPPNIPRDVLRDIPRDDRVGPYDWNPERWTGPEDC